MLTRFKNLDPMTKTTIKVCAMHTAVIVVATIVAIKAMNTEENTNPE